MAPRLVLLAALLAGTDGRSAAPLRRAPVSLRPDEFPPLDVASKDCLGDGVVVVDAFLDEAEVARALSQMKLSPWGAAPFGVRESGSPEQYFVVDMPPSVASRIRSEVNGALGFPDEAEGVEGSDQTKLPARTIYGPAEEHRDEPKTAPAWSRGRWEGSNAAALEETERLAYRDGFAAIVYLGGEGALRIGDTAIAAVPGRLVFWPNALPHASSGKTRHVLGPFAVLPGDAAAPLWLTTKGVGAVTFGVGLLGAGSLLAVPQIVVGSLYFGDESCRLIPEYLVLSGSLKLLIVLVLLVFFGLCVVKETKDETEEQGDARDARNDRNFWKVTMPVVAFLALLEVATVVFGATVTVTYLRNPGGCPDAVLGMAAASYCVLALIGAVLLKNMIPDSWKRTCARRPPPPPRGPQREECKEAEPL